MFKKLLLGFSLMCLSQFAFSHPGGHGFVNGEQAVAIASSITEQFVNFDPGLGFGKLDESWKDLPIENRMMHKTGDGYYIVSITNMKKGKTLFLLLSTSGEVFDANFTGEFKGIQ